MPNGDTMPNNNNRRQGSAIALFAVLSMIAVTLYALFSTQIAVVGATLTSNAIGANVAIVNTCVPTVSNTGINFGSVAPGSFAATANAENVMNFGNTASNIFVFGAASNAGNWVYNTNSFLVTNTLWDLRSRGANNGNQLANTVTSVSGQDTQMQVTKNGGGNTIFFGVNVPSTQAAGTYTTTIDVMLSC